MPTLQPSIPWTTGNRLRLLNSGHEFFPALRLAIGQARREIFLETYIYANDETAQSVTSALADAAQRGVKVHVLIDGFGSPHFAQEHGDTLRASGARFQIYRPEITPWRLRRNRLRRLHRKLVVIDQETVFVGGINIIDDNNAPPKLAPRVDFAVCATGPIAKASHPFALRLWATVARSGFQAQVQHWSSQWLEEYRQLRRTLLTGFAKNYPLTPEHETPGRCRFLPRDNLRYRNTIADAYLNAIQQAQHEILLAHAYFLPAFRFRHALRDAAQRGVRVTILLQGSTDHRLLQYATRALYGSLLKDGIELFEYTRSFLHAKVGVIDGQWATVGSSNIDPFSLELAQEGNLEIRDGAFAQQLTTGIRTLIADGAAPITADSLREAGWLSRFNRWLAYGLVRLLITLAGYGKNRGMR